MNTFILNPNDTIVMSDSIIVKAMRMSSTCQTCINETANNWADVEIARQISCTLITIVAICVAGYILVKLIEIISKYCSEERKKKRDEEESSRKQKANLQDKLLSFIEKNTLREEYKKEEDKKEKDKKEKDKMIKVQKGIALGESLYYIDVLKALIEKKEIPNYSQKQSIDENKEPQQN